MELLLELREIVQEFIRRIRQVDFTRDDDVKMLYERPKKIETRIENVAYNGNAADVNRLLAVTEKLRKVPPVRVLRIRPFRAVTSGPDSFDNVMGRFRHGRRRTLI